MGRGQPGEKYIYINKIVGVRSIPFASAVPVCSVWQWAIARVDKVRMGSVGSACTQKRK